MSYPQAPWALQGFAVAALHVIDIDRVRPFIPQELDIIPVWLGKTLGGVYLSRYGTGSVLEYSELIVVAGFVNYQGNFGAWISHIYVDNPDSVAGGREIWGLPKELAEFTWQSHRVTVSQDDNILGTLNYDAQGFAWNQWFAASSFSTMHSNLLVFPAEVRSHFGFIGSKLEVPATSPFAHLNLDQPLISVRCENMRLQVDAPKVVGITTNEFSYRV